jgi:adenylosuccinate synthase
LKICTAYKTESGELVTVPPTAAEGYEKITPVYEELPGWSEKTFGLQSVEELPANAKAYIKRIEELTGVPVDIISTGPDRNETMILVNPFAE